MAIFKNSLTINVAGAGDITLTEAQLTNQNIVLDGVRTGDGNVFVPTTKRTNTFFNDTSGAYTLTVTTESGTGVEVAQGEYATLVSDGTNVVEKTYDGGDAATLGGHAASYFQQKDPAPVALVDGANIATDASAGQVFDVTLAGNRTLDAPTNAADGMKRVWRFRQDATGSRTITLDAAFRLGADVTAVTLSTAAGKTDYMGAVYNAADSKWDVVSFVRGF